MSNNRQQNNSNGQRQSNQQTMSGSYSGGASKEGFLVTKGLRRFIQFGIFIPNVLAILYSSGAWRPSGSALDNIVTAVGVMFGFFLPIILEIFMSKDDE